MRATLVARTREILARAGYYLSQDAALRPLSFDIVARRDDELLLVKVLTNVDGLSEPVASELRVIARFLDAAPLVVGARSSSRDLEDGAVYLRYGVNIITFETLREYLEDGVAPIVYAAPGGFYVNLDGAKLRGLREQRGLSLGDLAQAAGVSRRAIAMYEEGMGAMVDVAMRLEEFLEDSLAVPTDPFRSPSPVAPGDDIASAAPTPRDVDGFEGTMLRRMEALGFRVVPTSKSPFSAISKESDEVVLTGVGAATPDLEKRAAATADLCDVTETYGVFFVERTTTRVAIDGLPVVSREELTRVDEAEKLLKLLQERRGRKR
jgi:putative transcriptional regulator